MNLAISHPEVNGASTAQEKFIRPIRLRWKTCIALGKLNALIASHGHIDHYGGLIGFLEKYRSVLLPDVKLYAGGEDNFCHRVSRASTGQYGEGGTLDRREIAAQKVQTVLCETPTVIEGHAFTTGKIKRNSVEKVLPNTFDDYTPGKDGPACDYGHYTAAELQGKIVPDEHVHEHATCFNIRGKGLVVISSCGHVGIVNSVRQGRKSPASRRFTPSSAASIWGQHQPITSSRLSERSKNSSPMWSFRCIAAV